ncbi:MAG: zf-HC2 domain-containing protein [Gemmatimonadota bacterium]
MRAIQRISCDRTRDLISTALDGRLHDLERRFLDAHVRRCPECKAFAEETEWFTQVMRTAEPLRPGAPVTLPRRRRGVQVRTIASASAAAIVLVLAGGVALTAPVQDNPERALVAPAVSPSLLAGESIRSLRRADVISGRLTFGSPPERSNLGAVKPLVPAG